MLLQAITIQDQLYEQRAEVGGLHPALTCSRAASFPRSQRIADAVTRATRHEALPPRRHRPALRAHAARCGASASSRNLEQVRALGYRESFVRLWEFYLCYCEGGFVERQLGDVQMLLTKPRCRRAPLAGSGA